MALGGFGGFAPGAVAHKAHGAVAEAVDGEIAGDFEDAAAGGRGCVLVHHGIDAKAWRGWGAQVEIAASRMVMAVRVFTVMPRIRPLPGWTRVDVDELTFRVVTHATGAE